MRRLFSYANGLKPITLALLISFLVALQPACNNPASKKDFIEAKNPAVALKGSTENSIYQLDARWTTQDDQQIPTKALAGKIQVVAMIFTSCGYACPAIVQNMQRIESSLSANAQAKTHFTLISFDTKTDTPERLRQYAAQKNLGRNWTLLHGSDEDVRLMSMLLNVSFSASTGGGFNHANVITILDQNGAILQRLEGLEVNTAAAVQTIEAASIN